MKPGLVSLHGRECKANCGERLVMSGARLRHSDEREVLCGAPEQNCAAPEENCAERGENCGERSEISSRGPAEIRGGAWRARRRA
jgi:hypothetical protein